MVKTVTLVVLWSLTIPYGAIDDADKVDEASPPLKSADGVTAELDRLQRAFLADPDNHQTGRELVRAIETLSRLARRAAVHALCESTDQLSGIEKFERSHETLCDRLCSSDTYAVCHGLKQLERSGDTRAAPYVAYHIREFGPIGKFAVNAATKFDHPLVARAIVDRLRSPVDLNDDRGGGVFGAMVNVRVLTSFGAPDRDKPLFEYLSSYKVKAAAPTLLALLETQSQSANQPWTDSERPGNLAMLCQTITDIGDSRALAALVAMYDRDVDDNNVMVMFGGAPGGDATVPDPVLQAMIELSGQSPARYGMRQGDSMLRQMTGAGGLRAALVFEDKDAQKAAAEKFAEWWRDNGSTPEYSGVMASTLPALPKLGRPFPMRPGVPPFDQTPRDDSESKLKPDSTASPDDTNAP